MSDCIINKAFVEALEEKIPKKTLLADFVSEVLCMEKETAYRRLRGEVQFSLRETSLLASRLHISLDEIIARGDENSQKKLCMQIPVDYLEKAQDVSLAEDYIHYLEQFVQEDYSEFGMALSGIPFSLFFPYKLLTRFFILKYVHHAGNSLESVPFREIAEANVKYTDDLDCLLKEITETCYIWDRMIIKLLVSDIKYSRSIRLMNDNEVGELKKELHYFLNDLEQLASKGRYEETGNKFELYISDAHIETSYACLSSPNRQMSLLSSFIFFMMSSQSNTSFTHINNWIKSLKRYSTLISSVGERERIMFFDQQREIIDTL
ncbi:hypothetical protein LJC44_05315 [Parabacteroides sp. OttesenSCG-928-G06]|nr:hypothetical protein [Parabacteroides sp. OttesenSCG-928-G06]